YVQQILDPSKLTARSESADTKPPGDSDIIDQIFRMRPSRSDFATDNRCEPSTPCPYNMSRPLCSCTFRKIKERDAEPSTEPKSESRSNWSRIRPSVTLNDKS